MKNLRDDNTEYWDQGHSNMIHTKNIKEYIDETSYNAVANCTDINNIRNFNKTILFELLEENEFGLWSDVEDGICKILQIISNYYNGISIDNEKY